MPWLPKSKFMDWPDDAIDLAPAKVEEMYANGFAGAKHDPAALARFMTAFPMRAEDIAHASKFADSAAGKLVIPFVHVVEMFPGCWPGISGQGRGSCVAWNTRNAALLTMVCDIVAGLPDEKTGKPEERPDVPAAGIADGVMSTESIYWYRGYDGDGWSCPDAAMVACKKGGLFIRQNYPELGFDLTSYSARTEGKWGRTPPPASVQAETSKHVVHEATDVSSFDAVRDFLHNGYGISTCGGEGLSNHRDENGVSRRSGNWAHAMSYIGADDRDIVKQKYGQPLVLDLNSWAEWNSGPRDIIESASLVPPDKKALWTALDIVNPATGNIMIPKGSCWVRYSEMKNREMIAFSGAVGWPRKPLPNLGTHIWG